jgi:hypothetical protein
MGPRKSTEQCGWNRAEMTLRGAALVTMMETADFRHWAYARQRSDADRRTGTTARIGCMDPGATRTMATAGILNGVSGVYTGRKYLGTASSFAILSIFYQQLAFLGRWSGSHIDSHIFQFSMINSKTEPAAFS